MKHTLFTICTLFNLKNYAKCLNVHKLSLFFGGTFDLPNCGVHMHVFLLGQEGGKKLNIGSEHILEMIRGDLKITILA